MAKNIDLGKIKGNDATVNGKTSLTIIPEDGLQLEQQGTVLNIKTSGISENITRLLDGKVDKEDGKQLSQEDFTNDLKHKLEGISTNANRVILDTELSDDSLNPLQNKIIDESLKNLSSTVNSLQDKVVGTEGQVLMFGEGGSLTAGKFPDSAEGFKITGMVMESAPSKREYFAGERFDPAGMVLKLNYTNGLSIPLDIRSCKIVPEMALMDTTNFTISFDDGTGRNDTIPSVTHNITVKKKILTVPTFTGNYTHIENENKYRPSFEGFSEEYFEENPYVELSGDLLKVSRENLENNYSTTFTLKDSSIVQWADGSTDPKTLQWNLRNAKTFIYGFELNLDESSPSNNIKYLEENTSFRPARMDYTKNRFDYGDWENIWFIKDLKVVMLGFDGQIMYELNKNNYKQKAIGGDSEITSVPVQGNVMVGMPTVWIKIDNSNRRKPKFYFANKRVDSSYNAYAHTNNQGQVVPYIYMNAYDTTHDGRRFRSLSGLFPTTDRTMDDGRRYSKAIGDNWDMGTFSDRMLITLLLLLIGKSTDSQTTFGIGVGYVPTRDSNYNSDNIIKSGTLDDKGLFYGYSTYDKAVKVFGIENFWGSTCKKVLGFMRAGNSFHCKLTKGRQDGTTVDDYSTTSTEGHIFTHTLGTNKSFYISHMNAGPFGLLPVYKESSNSGMSTYFCDYMWNALDRFCIPLIGGHSGDSSNCGLFSLDCRLYPDYGDKFSVINLSYKPNA